MKFKYCLLFTVLILSACNQNKKRSFYKEVVEPNADKRTELFETVLEDKNLYQNISPRNISNIDKFNGFRNLKINSNISNYQINKDSYYDLVNFENYKSLSHNFKTNNRLADGTITDVRFEFIDENLKFIKVYYQEQINKKDYVESHLNTSRTISDFEDYDELSIVELYSTVFGSPKIEYIDGNYGFDLYDYLEYPVCYGDLKDCLQEFSQGDKNYGILLRWKGSKINYDLFFKEQYNVMSSLFDDGMYFKIKAELYIYDNSSKLNKDIIRFRIKKEQIKLKELQKNQDKDIIEGL